MDGVVLALDTSTETLACALHAHGRAYTHHGPGGAAASAGLLPALQALLAQARLGWPDVRAIAFGQGPGAFTGLRTSCAVAQGLAFGLGLRLWPIDSLMLVAEDAAAASLGDAAAQTVAVAMDARMGEVYAAAYQQQPGGVWQVLLAPVLAHPAAWAVPASATLCAGSAWADAALAQTLPVPPGAAVRGHGHNRAAALLRLALAAVASGPGVAPEHAMPLYLRNQVALTTAERALIASTRACARAAQVAALAGSGVA